MRIVDGANTWELKHARQTTSTIRLLSLPDYHSLAQLAERSWGHHLAASATLLYFGYQLGSPEQRALERFFKHFLIARQLNDDAHDWEDDLLAGHLSAVVCLLLRGYGAASVQPSDETTLTELRLYFWRETIVAVSTLIEQHLAIARQALMHCPFANPAEFAGWLDRLSTSADRAMHERQETQKFMTAYAQEEVV